MTSTVTPYRSHGVFDKSALVIEVDGDNPLRPSVTSPKYDMLKSECGFKVYIVGFGGGWVGVERREKALRELGLKIVRFRNDEVVKDLMLVVAKIRELILIIGR